MIRSATDRKIEARRVLRARSAPQSSGTPFSSTVSIPAGLCTRRRVGRRGFDVGRTCATRQTRAFRKLRCTRITGRYHSLEPGISDCLNSRQSRAIRRVGLARAVPREQCARAGWLVHAPQDCRKPDLCGSPPCTIDASNDDDVLATVRKVR